MKGILGRKVEMTQVFTQEGLLVPVTVIAVEKNTVLQVKSVEKDGYTALKIGTFAKRENLVNKPDMGNFKKAKSEPKRFVKEIRDMDGYEIGAEFTAADVFTAGELIDVTGISKGKGFAGSIKRHNYTRGPMGHGSGYHRGVGSMGAIINRIFKSKKMPGHMGHEQVTIQNLEIISIDNERNLVLVKGSIPGPRKGHVVLKQNVKGLKARDAKNLLNRSKKAAAPATETVAETPAE